MATGTSSGCPRKGLIQYYTGDLSPEGMVQVWGSQTEKLGLRKEGWYQSLSDLKSVGGDIHPPPSLFQLYLEERADCRLYYLLTV